MILICCDSHKTCLRKRKGFICPNCLIPADVRSKDPLSLISSGGDVHHMYTGLIAMHRVQDDVSIVIHLIVRQFDFVKGYDLLHPVRAFSRRVGMNMDAGRSDGVRFSCHNPRRAVDERDRIT